MLLFFFNPAPLCDKHIMSAPLAHLSVAVPLYQAEVKRIDVSGEIKEMETQDSFQYAVL